MAISGYSGTLNNGEAITLSGSGFGSKSQAAPLISSYNHPTSGNNWAGGVFGGNWTRSDAGVALSNSAPLRTSLAQSSYKISYNVSGGYISLRYDRSGSDDYFYASWWQYRDSSSWNISSGNMKFVRIYQSSNTSDGNVWVTLDSSGSNPTAMRFGGDNIGSSTYSIGGYGSGYKNSGASTLDMGTTVSSCYPYLQVWEHWELYIKYPTSLGGGDAEVALNKNGLTVYRATSASINQASQGNDHRWILIGQVSGGRGSSYDEYIDECYVDNTPSKVFISDRSDISNYFLNGNSAHNEIQVCSSWSDTSVQFTLNRGTFGATDSVYIYLVDSSGNIMQYGPVTLGSGGGLNRKPFVGWGFWGALNARSRANFWVSWGLMGALPGALGGLCARAMNLYRRRWS